MAKNFGIGSISFIGGFMEYVYHMVPEELKGEYLIPLNELKRVYQIYIVSISKNIKIILKERTY